MSAVRPSRPLKILIAEDDFTNRSVLLELLRHHGIVHVAVNGREALAAVRAALEVDDPYAMVCLDIMMPEMDGLEALRALRELETARGIPAARALKIFMITGSSDFSSVCRAYHGLCDAYLVKPLDRAKLIAEMRSAGLVE